VDPSVVVGNPATGHVLVVHVIKLWRQDHVAGGASRHG